MIFQIDANCSPSQFLNIVYFHIRLERVKQIYCSLISILSIYYIQTGTLCLPFLSSHIFIALEINSDYFGILPWKIVKPRDHNEMEPPIGKIFRKYEPIRHYFVMSRKLLSRPFLNEIYDNCNKVFYLQKNKKSYDWETAFEKKVKFFWVT